MSYGCPASLNTPPVSPTYPTRKPEIDFPRLLCSQKVWKCDLGSIRFLWRQWESTTILKVTLAVIVCSGEIAVKEIITCFNWDEIPTENKAFGTRCLLPWNGMKRMCWGWSNSNCSRTFREINGQAQSQNLLAQDVARESGTFYD